MKKQLATLAILAVLASLLTASLSANATTPLSRTVAVNSPRDTRPKTPAEKSAQTFWDLKEKFRDAGDYPRALEAYKKVKALVPNSEMAGGAFHGIGWITPMPTTVLASLMTKWAIPTAL